MGFWGYAVGGLSVGAKAMMSTLGWTIISGDGPVFMGGNTRIFSMRSCSVSISSVRPSHKNAQWNLFTSGKISIKRPICEDERPIGETCSCYTCRNYSRAYLRHLYAAGNLSSRRRRFNLHYYIDFIKQIRQAIDEDSSVFINLIGEFSRVEMGCLSESQPERPDAKKEKEDFMGIGVAYAMGGPRGKPRISDREFSRSS
jgi:tRNA-guanine family transglycosylase